MLPWKDFFDTIVDIVKFIKEGYSNTATNRKNFFLEHIQPSYDKIEIIHKDYLSTLFLLLQIKNKKKKAQYELVDWLKERKIQFQTERVRLNQLTPELMTSHFFQKSFKKNAELSKYTEQYMHDLVKYFYHGNYLQDMTWYGYLIQLIEFSASSQIKYPDAEPVGASAIASSTDIFKVIETTTKVIQSQFNFIVESYSKLRGICLT